MAAYVGDGGNCMLGGALFREIGELWLAIFLGGEERWTTCYCSLLGRRVAHGGVYFSSGAKLPGVPSTISYSVKYFL